MNGLISSKLGLKIPDFLMPMKINAAVYNGDWVDSNNINMVSWGGIMDCTSSSSCSSIGVNNQILSTQNKTFTYISATEQVSSTASGGGYGFYYNTNYLMKTGYLYNITTYVCSTKSFSDLDVVVSTGTTSSNILTSATAPKYQDTIRTALNPEVGSYCYAFQSLVVPGVDGQWFRGRLFGASTSSNALSLIGFSIEGLGIYSNSIQEIITNSDLATNEDLNNVTNEILNGEHEYNKEASEEVKGKEDLDNYAQKEEELFNNLNFEGIGNNEITINPGASTFIWEIVERLRGMNGKIVLLMTSILGIGIIKLLLNR